MNVAIIFFIESLVAFAFRRYAQAFWSAGMGILICLCFIVVALKVESIQ